MKSFILRTIWAGLLTSLAAAGIVAGQGTANKVFWGVVLLIVLGFYLKAAALFIKWRKALPEERTKIEEERRKNKGQRRYNFFLFVNFVVFTLIAYLIGDLTNWNFLYVILLAGFIGLGIIPKLIEGMREARSRKNEEAVRKVQAEIDSQKREEAVRKENAWKDEPHLWLGEKIPPRGEKALGHRRSIDNKTGRMALELKIINDPAGDRHIYVIGGSGSGKTKFLESLIIQDIRDGAGFGVIDPHGDMIEEIKGYLMFWARRAKAPELNYGLASTASELTKNDIEEHIQRLMHNIVLIDPADEKAAVRFNPLEPVHGVPSAAIANEMVASFKKIWEDSWGPRMEDVLRNTFIALSESGGSLADMPEFFADPEFRRSRLAKVKNANCLTRFRQFEQESERMWLTRVEPVVNKINAILADPRIASVFASSKSTFNLRGIMDEGKILLVKLDKGQLKSASDLFGSLLLSKIQMAALSRSNQAAGLRRPFTLYMDEFQNFATENFVQTLSEARKYKLSLVLAHQNLSQLPEQLQASVFSNCGIHVYFKMSYKDAQILSKEGLNFPYWEPSGMDKLFMQGTFETSESRRDDQAESEPWRMFWYNPRERTEILQALDTGVCVVRDKSEAEAERLAVPKLFSFWAGVGSDLEWIKQSVEPMIGAAYMRSPDGEQQGAEAERLAGEFETPEEPASFRESKNQKF